MRHGELVIDDEKKDPGRLESKSKPKTKLWLFRSH